MSDTWWSLIGDTCHSLIGPLMSSLTRARLLVSSLTRTRLLLSSLTRALIRDWFLHDTWQISVGFWVVIAKSSSNTWRFVIGVFCGLGSMMCQLVIGREFFPLYNIYQRNNFISSVKPMTKIESRVSYIGITTKVLQFHLKWRCLLWYANMGE